MTARYDDLGVDYARYRKPDPRIAAQVRRALGDADTVANVGAGAGSYEPADCVVTAVEPSTVMLEQRPPAAPTALRATAEALPFADDSFAAAMAILTIHHWTDPMAGVREMVRVAPRRQVFLTWDQSFYDRFWLTRDYFGALRDMERSLAGLEFLVRALAPCRVEPVLVPHDCTDGFFAAYWRRPRAYLDPGVQGAISGVARLHSRVRDAALARLEADLQSGDWARRHADLLELDELDAGYRLVIAGS